MIFTIIDIFLNGKLTYIRNSHMEYYKVLRDIYATIIGKWNSSVANVFVDAFNLKLHGKDRMITRKEFREFLLKVMRIDLRHVENEKRNFGEFFIMFFDKSNLGFTNLASILSVFRDKVEIKIQMSEFLHICINAIVDYENFIVSEMHRLYFVYEDVPNIGMSVSAVENVMNKIGTNFIH